MSGFGEIKSLVLASKDNSNKGSIDAPIRELVDFINKLDCFVTTSSCSGRVVVFEEVSYCDYKIGHKNRIA